MLVERIPKAFKFIDLAGAEQRFRGNADGVHSEHWPIIAKNESLSRLDRNLHFFRDLNAQKPQNQRQLPESQGAKRQAAGP